MGTLISMLNLGVGDSGPRGLRPGPSGAWGLGSQAPIMRGEVATGKSLNPKPRCFDATRLVHVRLPALCSLAFSVVAQEINRRDKPGCRDCVRTNTAFHLS